MPRPSGGERATLQDVAALAGVSMATCSYVLSGRSDRVHPLPEVTQAKVIEAARRLGYAGNAAARALRRQRTELIALVYVPPVGPWLDRLTMQCEVIATEHGYSVIGLPIRRPDPAAHALRVISQGQVDGAIFAPGLAERVDLNSLSRTTRALLVFSEHLPAGPVDVIRNQVRHGLAEATTYLLGRGARRIAFLSKHDDDAGDDELYQGFLDAHQDAGVQVDPTLVRAGAVSREEAVVTVRSLLQLPEPPQALISATDRGALAALQAARDCGLQVPQELAVVGVGNTTEGAVSSPPLTSVGMAEFDFTEVVETLFTRIDDPTLPARELVLPWVLNPRQST